MSNIVSKSLNMTKINLRKIRWNKLDVMEKVAEFCKLLCPHLKGINGDLWSPSTITFPKPNSWANQRACYAASTSTISTEVGSGIFCDKATITIHTFVLITNYNTQTSSVSPIKNSSVKVNFEPAEGRRTPSN